MLQQLMTLVRFGLEYAGHVFLTVVYFLVFYLMFLTRELFNATQWGRLDVIKQHLQRQVDVLTLLAVLLVARLILWALGWEL